MAKRKQAYEEWVDLDLDEGFEERRPKRRPPLPFQVEPIAWLSQQKSALLAYGMGLGKTKISLDALHVSGEKKAVVVCKAALISHWEREVKLEVMTPYAYAGADRKETLKRFIQASEGILILSFDICGAEQDRLPDQLPALPLIVDEAHLSCRASSRRTWGLWRLKKSRVWLLTGTELMNRLEDIYPILSLLGIFKGKLAGFRELYCWRKEVACDIYVYIPKPGSAAEIAALIEPYTKRFSGEGLKPTIQRESVEVVPSDEKRKRLDVLQRRISVYLRGSGGLYPVEKHLLPILTEWRVESSTPHSVEDARFKALLGILRSVEGKSFVVTAFKETAIKIQELLKTCGVASHMVCGSVALAKRDTILREFSCDKVRVLIGVQGACKEGLNLPYVKNLAWYDGAWNRSTQLQVEDRIRRVNSSHKEVSVYHLVEEETPEAWMAAIRKRKGILAGAVRDTDSCLQEAGYYKADSEDDILCFIKDKESWWTEEEIFGKSSGTSSAGGDWVQGLVDTLSV